MNHSAWSFRFLILISALPQWQFCCTTKRLWKLVLSLEINKYLKVCVHGPQLSCAAHWMSMHPSVPNQSGINPAQWRTGLNKCTSLIEDMTFTCWSGYLNSIHIEPQRFWRKRERCWYHFDLTFRNVPECHCMFTLVFCVLCACICGLSWTTKFEKTWLISSSTADRVNNHEQRQKS